MLHDAAGAAGPGGPMPRSKGKVFCRTGMHRTCRSAVRVVRVRLVWGTSISNMYVCTHMCV